MLSKPVAAGLVAASLASASIVTPGPCDLYASGNTPCVAAHSTTRALYGTYTGPLYQLQRGSGSNSFKDIKPTTAGGVANTTMHDEFCGRKTCYIVTIYDQSGRGNDLTVAPPGGAATGPGPNGYDLPAIANAAPVSVNGQKAYGVYISPGMGYRNDEANGTATGDAPQGIYSIFDGTHFNDGCCFDYGNAETNNLDTGNGHMEAIYFGNNRFWGTGAGNGPWIMADLENGLFSGQDPGLNIKDVSIKHQFVTAIVKGKPNHWAIRGGDAAKGKLKTFFNGGRPTIGGYNPMSKEGAIILGIGGDNSISGEGTWFEGAMTAGYPSDKTENQVQANIVAAKYMLT